MNSDGQDLINIIIRKLEEEGNGHRLFDSVIMDKLRVMTSAQLNQAIVFGDVQEWHNERKQKEWQSERIRIKKEGKQCSGCFNYKDEEMDSYISYECASYDPPTPGTTWVLCQNCADGLEGEFVKQFKKGNYRGHWQKSRAEQRAAERCGLVWTGNEPDTEWEESKKFNEYMPKKGDAHTAYEEVGNG